LRQPGKARVLWAREADPERGYDGPAAWLRLPDGVAGLAPPGAPLGPLWITRADPWPVLTDGAVLTVDDAGLHDPDGALVVDRRQAAGWKGPLPDPAALSAAAARAVVTGALALCRPSILLDAPWREAVEPAAETIGRLEPLDSLSAVARALGGLGPGLTPAGDDALSGVLFAFRAMAGPSVQPALLSVANSVSTNELGVAVLEAAATGAHIEPVHDLVMAAVANDTVAAAKAATALDRFGSSSGADIAYGLRLAFTRR
jgi:hypothetical protein